MALRRDPPKRIRTSGLKNATKHKMPMTDPDVPDDVKNYDLKPFELDDIDRKLLGLIRDYPAMTYKELGEQFGLSRMAIQLRYKRPAFQKALADLAQETWEIAKKAQRAAMLRLLSLTQSRDERIALDACKWITKPMFDKAEVNINEVKEIVYQTKIEEGGAIVTDKKIIEVPKDTLELLGQEHADGKTTDLDEPKDPNLTTP